MRGMDGETGGAYFYQWECAMLLALNCVLEPVRYDPLSGLVAGFLEQVDAIHLEGEERQQGVELEDINLIASKRRILIQVKTKEDASAYWTLSDRSLLKALFRFYNSPFLTEQPDDTRFVFLTNRQLNKDLLAIQQAIDDDMLDRCPEADRLLNSLNTYAVGGKKAEGKRWPPLDARRFREMLARTTLLKYMEEGWLKSTVQLTLRAYGRSDWQQAHATLLEYFAWESTRKGGGVVTRESIIEKLGPKAPDADLRDKELAYLHGVLEDYRDWRDHYTPLAGTAKVRDAIGDGSASRLPTSLFPREFEKLVEYGIGERPEVRRVPVDDLRAAVTEHRRILLLGEPGSGKTTTLKQLAYEYATAAREDSQQPLPLLVRLGEYIEPAPFEVHLARHLGPLESYVATYLRSGRLVLLLDGLNEMPRADYADRVRWIRELLDDRHQGTVVVTCRKLDYEDRQEKLQKLQEVEIKPLDEARMRTFLHKYLGETDGDDLFWLMAGGDEVRTLWNTWQEAGGTWAEFWTKQEVYRGASLAQALLWSRLLEEPPALLELGRIPYLLSLTAEIYRIEGEKLPANRAGLFTAFVGMLLEREKKRQRERWVGADLLQDGLAELAYAMQAERGSGTTVERAWAEARLSKAVPDGDAKLLLYLAASANLLEAGDATVRFCHQLLQEYFAAREMGRRLAAGEPLSAYWSRRRWWELLSTFWPRRRWWLPSGWEETAILLAGMEPDFSGLLERLAQVNPVVAARCLIEGGAQASEVARQAVVEALIVRMADERLWPVARAQAGDALARLGDPRPGVGPRRDGLPDIVWCEVPAGPFRMGSDKEQDPRASDDEFPRHEVSLPAYSISKYPITQVQYAAFVATGGYDESRFWTNAGWRWKGERTAPVTYGDPLGLSNHPVVGVSWYEAVAFCRWLTERLRERGEIQAGKVVRLPSEAEWEKAARGTDRRIYPWGNAFAADKCNLGRTLIHTTSAVGCFPGGASPYGVEDLSGNACDWCVTKWRNNYREPADESPEGDGPRVFRGGSFHGDQGSVRCAYRDGLSPDYRYDVIGFRVVVAPVPSGL